MSVAERQITQQQYDLAQLGDGAVFIKRTPDGRLKSVKGLISLQERLGHLAEISGKIMITGAGFNELNKIAGISVITPDKLTLPDGQIVVNPFPIIDRQSGTIEKVWVKKMGIGYSPIGNLVITASTLLYDITMYFIQDIAKKIQQSKTAGRVCLKSMLTEDELKKGIFHSIQGELGVWADYSHPDILKALDTFIQNKLFAERKAQTICERNVMKKHPALAVVNVLPDGPQKARVARVPVIGFCHEFSKDDLLAMAQKVSDGEDVDESGQKADVIDVTAEVSEEDIQASDEDEETGAGAGENTGGQVGMF